MSDAGVFALLGGFIAVLLVIGLVIYVLTVIAFWRIFTKAGQPGWMSIIPFLNVYVLFKIGWETKWFWVLLALEILSTIFAGAGGDNGFVGFLAFIVTVATLVLTILLWRYIARSFGQGAGFTVGLVLLNTIFVLILGLGSYAYEGNGAELVQRDKGNI